MRGNPQQTSEFQGSDGAERLKVRTTIGSSWGIRDFAPGFEEESDSRLRIVKSTLSRLLAGALALVLLVFAALWAWSRHFAASPELPPRAAPVVLERSVRVAIIGDSWAAGRKLDDFVAEELGRRGWEVEIISRGHPGAKSRTILNNLLASEDKPHSSRDVLFGRPVHAAVVIAGVNDSQGYIGADHYAHHVTLIAEALRRRGIFPMVVELPEYGIEHATSSDPLGQVRRRLMRRIYHGDRVDVIPMYRAALEQALAPRLARGQVDLIDFDPVTADFHRSRDLFLPDAIHLSEKGRRVLARQIGAALDARLRRLAERRPDQVGSASGSSRPPA